MTAFAERTARDTCPKEDHFITLRGATWADYERLLELRGECSVPRITYLLGTIEFMSPSRDHEAIKSWIGRLVETYCLEREIRFSPVGSWTLKGKRKQSGAEPDECYLFGEGAQPDAMRPHLAIEVVWTSGGIDKLEVYRKLGVREVWYWRKGAIQPYLLRDDGYETVATSEQLPGIDLAQLASFMNRPTAYDAIQDYRRALRASSTR